MIPHNPTRVIRSILVRLSQISPNDYGARISDTISQLSTSLISFARTQGFEVRFEDPLFYIFIFNSCVDLRWCLSFTY